MQLRPSRWGDTERTSRRRAILANVDLEKIIAQLREERAAVDAAILALERLQGSTGKRRGRPPKWLAELKARDEAEERQRKRAHEDDE